MNVLIINGSPRAEGGTATALRVVGDELMSSGIDVETLDIGKMDIRGCIACNSCRKTGQCVFNHDIVNACVEKIRKANGVVVGSPVYYGGINGTLKCFLDRVFYSGKGFEFKTAAAVVVSRREGGISSFHEICNYFNLAQMIITPSDYWSSVYGSNAEGMSQDAEGVQHLKVLGRNMAWLLKITNAAPMRTKQDDEIERTWTNFIRP